MEETGSRPTLNQAGFLAAQSLIGAAIVAATAMVLLGILSNLSQLSGRYIIKEQVTGATRAVQAVLMQEEVCSSAIRTSAGGAVPFDNTGPQDVGDVVSPGGAGPKVVIATGQPFQPLDDATVAMSRISIGQIQLVPVAANAPAVQEVVYTNSTPPTPVTYNTYLARLVFPASSGQPYDAALEKALPTQAISLKLFVDGTTGLIARCFSLANDTQTCRAFGGNVNLATGVCILPKCDENTPGVLPCPPFDSRVTCNPGTGAAVSIPPSATKAWVWLFTNEPPQSPTGPKGMKCVCIQSCG